MADERAAKQKKEIQKHVPQSLKNEYVIIVIYFLLKLRSHDEKENFFLNKFMLN